jgi:hypothetical protein
MSEKNEAATGMPLADFATERQHADNISQRTGAADNDYFFPVAQPLPDEPQPEKNWIGNAIGERAKFLPK